MRKPLSQKSWSLLTSKGTLRFGPGDRKRLLDDRRKREADAEAFKAKQQSIADSYRRRPKPDGRA
ncbi:hypothetical protein BABAYKA_00070 [Brevundimonas phage vB_BpoS-Babayka]|uniref:Uncharacterized protein n=1 Tax=Brevundimonas phage vB_BpoS-Babayka TaxID=2948596 RepID=A0A9E7SM71_9CAUD|nr:hypothetical protein BABAYKA_00070 [Brevundimonas phage vB_BpoS-Babayka]